MTGKQRLALAISAALSIAGGTGCSTVSGMKATSASLEDEMVVVHHISYKGALQDRATKSTSSETNGQNKEQKLDNEINLLAQKLGLGQYAKNKQNKQHKQKSQKITRSYPSIKRTSYNNTKTKVHKILLHKPKAVVARRKVSLSYKPSVIHKATKKPIEAMNLSAFEREVNRLYSSEKTVIAPQQVSRNSLWSRLVSGYRLSSDTEKPLVQKILNQHANNPKHLNRIFARSGRYLHFILHELNRRGMPTELALLPMVESDYDNGMTSASGGTGLWQLTSRQGNQFGLKQTHDYDARRDVFASTRAILDQLQRLNKKFNGDWHLTLASYKAGEKRVHHEIAKNHSSNKQKDYWHLNLPQNTTEYVPQLLAYREILLRPHAYGLKLPVVTNTPQVLAVKVNKPIDLHKVAHSAGLPASTLVNLNLHFKNAITNPHLSRQIVLPRRYASQLHRAIRLSPAVIMTTYKPRGQSKRYVIKNTNKVPNRLVNYRVRAGENLYKIALRHGTTVTNIMRLNGMSNTRIKTGENLRVALTSSIKKSV